MVSAYSVQWQQASLHTVTRGPQEASVPQRVKTFPPPAETSTLRYCLPQVAKKVHAKFSGAEVEQKEEGSQGAGSSRRDSKWQQEFDKISAERRKREEEARKK